MSDTHTLRLACSEMAAFIAVLLTKNTFDPGHVAKAGDVLRGWTISESHEGEHLLKYILDLASPVGDQSYALTKSSDQFTDHFASGNYDNCFDAILQSYLGFVEWNGEVPTSRAWFTEPPKHSHILRRLAKLGYLEWRGDDLKWTDDVGQAMLCAGIWTSDMQSHEEIREWKREKEARQIAQSLPSEVVFLALNDPGAAFWKVHNILKGKAWHQMPEKLLVERVIELIRSRSSNR